MRRGPVLLGLLCVGAAVFPWHAGPLSRLSAGVRAHLTSSPVGAVEAVEAVEGEVVALDFDRLARREEGLHGRRVTFAAYAVPVEVAGGEVRRLLLVRDAFSCCFGMAPGDAGEWVLAVHPGGLALPGAPMVRVTGVLEVALRRDAAGEEVGLYTLRLTGIEALE